MRARQLAPALLLIAGSAIAQETNQGTAGAQQINPDNTIHVRGCLTAGGDQFKLTTDIGARVLNLSIDKNAATPFIAHEVEVQGAATPDGNFQVARIFDIADHCGHSGQTPGSESDVTVVPKHK